MNQILHNTVLISLFCVTAMQLQADDLDAALEAQKKKARRHVYSERAQLHDQNLIVPKEPTEEDEELDRKLREMERKLNTSPSAIAPRRSLTRPVRRPPTPTAEQENWLTPALLDEDAEMSLFKDESEDNWLLDEMQRQRTLGENPAAQQEEDLLVDDLLKREQQTQSLRQAPQLEQLKTYENLPGLLSSGTKEEDRPSYLTPQGRPNPFSTSSSVRPIRRRSRTSVPEEPALFSPEAARAAANPSSNVNPFRPATISGIQALTKKKEPSSQTGNVFTPSWEKKDAKPPSPLEKLRQKRPINQPDPFAEDGLPGF